MSTPTPARGASRAAALVPSPRQPADPPLDVLRGPGEPTTDDATPAGLLERRAWLIPAIAIASIVAVFVAMVVLTWAAGGGTPFDR